MNYVPHNCRITVTPKGVAIGCAYLPRPMPLTRDGEFLQRALLDQRTLRRPGAVQRALGAVWRAL